MKLCLQLLDGSEFKGHTIKVEKAKFEMKGTYDPTKCVALTEGQKKKLGKKKEKQILDKQRKRYLIYCFKIFLNRLVVVLFVKTFRLG